MSSDTVRRPIKRKKQRRMTEDYGETRAVKARRATMAQEAADEENGDYRDYIGVTRKVKNG